MGGGCVMGGGSGQGAGKVPEVTLAFWVVKVAATTLGETGGDAVSMTLRLGYAVGTAIFLALFLAAAAAQIGARRFHPLLYWAAIVATTTAGTTMADFADRSLGVGYVGGSLLLALLLGLTLWAWRRSTGSIAVEAIEGPRAEAFYWASILFSNTLGTALGDFLASRPGVGYEGGALAFAAALAVAAGAYLLTSASRTALFWAAFILTRPLGATVGDLLTKAHADGGLALSRPGASAAIGGLMLAAILLVPQRAGRHA